MSKDNELGVPAAAEPVIVEEAEENSSLTLGCQEISQIFISSSSYLMLGIVAPIMPKQFKERGIDQMWVGACMSTFALTSLVVSPIMGPLMTFGRRRLIMVGLAFLTVGSVVIGAASSHLHDQTWFLTAVMVGRVLEGLGCSLVSTSVISISATFYKENMEQMVGYNELGFEIGIAAGPFFGGELHELFHKALGFSEQAAISMIFFVLSALFIVFLCLVNVLLPPQFDMNTQEVEGNSEGEEDERPLIGDAQQQSTKKTVGYLDFFGNLRFTFASLSTFLLLTTMAYSEPIFANEMKQQYHLSQEQISYGFGVQSLCYMVIMCIQGRVARDVKPRIVIIYGFVVLTLGLLLCGPSQHLHLPKALWIILLGNGIVGVSTAFQFVRCFSEMIEVSAERGFPEGIAVDYSSAITATMINLGGLVGPLLSSWLTEKYSYAFAYEMLALICCVYFVLYLMFAGCTD